MLERPKKKRRLSRFITLINLFIIFMFIIIVNQYLFVVRTRTYNDFQIKYKCDNLKDNMGYIFSLSIINKSSTNRIVNKDNKVKFFIEEKNTGKPIWEKFIPKPSFPMGLAKTNSLILKSDDLISYAYIYNLQTETNIPEGEWLFGSMVTIGTAELILTIPRSTKPKKGWGKLIKY